MDPASQLAQVKLTDGRTFTIRWWWLLDVIKCDSLGGTAVEGWTCSTDRIISYVHLVAQQDRGLQGAGYLYHVEYIMAGKWEVDSVGRRFMMLCLLSPTPTSWLKWLLWGCDRCCVKGSLLEINNRVVDHPAILHSKVRSHTEMVDLILYWAYKGWSHNGGPVLCHMKGIGTWLRICKSVLTLFTNQTALETTFRLVFVMGYRNKYGWAWYSCTVVCLHEGLEMTNSI